MNSDFYKISKLFIVKEIIKVISLVFVTGYLFFDSMIAGLFTIPFMSFVAVGDLKKERIRLRKELSDDYKNAVVAMTGNLGAGYSVEKALVMGFIDVAKQKKKNSLLGDCAIEINNSLACNVALDKVLDDFADKSEIEDIKSFSELIVASKRYGGNIAYIARRYARNISDRQSLQLEIDTMISAKRMEGRIMIMAPFAIILYMRLTNPGYMTVLYNTGFGRVVMFISLLVILIAAFAIEKIMKIEV